MLQKHGERKINGNCIKFILVLIYMFSKALIYFYTISLRISLLNLLRFIFISFPYCIQDVF